MRFSSFFTMPTSPSTRLVAMLVGLSFCATSVCAQDRTTEAGEAAISSEYIVCNLVFWSVVLPDLNGQRFVGTFGSWFAGLWLTTLCVRSHIGGLSSTLHVIWRKLSTTVLRPLWGQSKFAKCV